MDHFEFFLLGHGLCQKNGRLESRTSRDQQRPGHVFMARSREVTSLLKQDAKAADAGRAKVQGPWMNFGGEARPFWVIKCWSTLIHFSVIYLRDSKVAILFFQWSWWCGCAWIIDESVTLALPVTSGSPEPCRQVAEWGSEMGICRDMLAFYQFCLMILPDMNWY